MKTFNTKFISSLFITLLLTGCMPDSLTKFKKDAPQKSASTDSGGTVTPPLVDGNGNVVDPEEIEYPTTFSYGAPGVNDNIQIYTPTNIPASIDGSINNTTLKKAIFIKCELDTSGPVVSRTLPPGLSVNQETCAIEGTPLSIYGDTDPSNMGGQVEYTVNLIYKGPNYAGAGTEAVLSTQIKLNVLDLPSALVMTQNDKLQIKLIQKSGTISSIQSNTDSLVNYNRYGLINTNKSVSGVVKYVDTSSNTIGVYRAQPIVVGSTIPFSVNGFISTAGNAKRGKILSINSTTRTLYVEALTSNTVFAAGDAIDNASSYLAAESTITSVDSTNQFSVGAKVDNDSQYFTEKFNIETVTQTYETGVAIQPISPILSTRLLPTNGIKYAITPVLPTGLSFDTETGIISGTFASTLDSTEFIITAYNDIGESNYSLRLAAINAPRDLSYTSNQLISVNSNSLFLEGENLYQPKTPPLTSSVQAKILRKVSTNKLSIETLNGSFLAEASLDSGNAYYSEKNYIPLASSPNYFNLAINVTSAASFTAGNYIASSSGAKGRVIYVDTVNNVLYVQFLTPNVVSATPAGALVVTFAEGATLDNVYPYAAPETTITQVESATMALTVSTTVGFDPGHDFTSNTSHSGYVYDWDVANDIIMVNEINRTGAVGSNYLRIGQNLDNSEYYALADASILGVTHDNLIVADRGVNTIIKGNVSQGTSLIYSVSPTLPTGLTLNALTGDITGTPTALSSRKSYVVTATNLLDKSFYTFDLEVRDHFSFSESSGAKSFLTHKIGSNRTNRACKINATDILNGTNASALDIGCELEAEELELFYAKLKMKAMVGSGICEYVGFTPYSFWQYAPERTTRTVNAVSGCTGGTAPVGAVTSTPTAENSCYGNYSEDDGPNCDTGTVTVNTYTTSNPGNPCDTVAQTTIACGGKKTACLAGPITSVITDSAALENGFRVSTVFSAEGVEKIWDIKSSVEFLDVTNLRNANGIVLNACSDTRADANTWASQTQAPTVAPHGGENPFYEFSCLDAAKDLKARIRLVVREWNRTFRINDLINDVLPTKMNTNALDPLFGSTYNQVRDWDDDYSGAGVAAIPTCGDNITASCSDPTYTTPTTCEKNGEVWTTDGFQFPKDNI